MSERIYTSHPADAGVAIRAQTVYSENRGYTPMAENQDQEKQHKKQPPPSAEKTANIAEALLKIQQSGGDVKSIQELLDAFGKENVKPTGSKGEAFSEFAGLRMHRKGEKKASQDEAKFQERKIAIVLPRQDAELAQAARGLERVLAKPFDQVSDATLLKYYILLRHRAEELGEDTSFLSDLEFMLKEERGIDAKRLYPILEATVDEEEREEVEMEKTELGELVEEAEELRKSGAVEQTGMPTFVGQFRFDDLTHVGEPVLDRIVGELNSIPTDQREARVDGGFVRDQQNRIDRYRDQNPAADAQAQNLWEQLERWGEQAENVLTARRRKQEEERLGLYLERQLTDAEKAQIEAGIDEAVNRLRDTAELRVEGAAIDKIYNKIYEEADSRPLDQWQEAFGVKGEFERRLFFYELNEMKRDATEKMDAAAREGDVNLRREHQRRADVIQAFLHKYDVEHKMRELLHNAYHIAETEGEFKDFAGFCTRFASHYADQAFKGAPEVESALRIRENILYQIKRKYKGYIPPERVMYNPFTNVSEWEEEAREVLRKLNAGGAFTENRTPLPEWKINRALSISRGMGMVLLRFPEIIAETHIMAPSSSIQSQPSVPWEKLVWDLNPMDYKLKRYEMGFGLRALMYATRHRTNKGLWNQDELRAALALDAVTVFGDIGKDRRMADLRNIFQTGGPFTHTGWRPYAAALDESRDQLRPLLDRSPGLAMNMLFNKYENRGQNKRRWELMKRYRGTGVSEKEILKEWEEEKPKYREEDQGVWKKKEITSWLASTRRIPHVILRILTDKTNQLLDVGESNALFREISGGASYADRWYTEAEIGLTIAKENLMKRRKEALAGVPPNATREQILAAFPPSQDQLLPEDFERIEDPAQRANAQKLHDVMVAYMERQAGSGGGGIYEKILKKIEERAGFAYAVTAEDVPWSEFAYGQTGPRGFFTRKINDALEVASGNEELIELIKYTIPDAKGPEDLVAQLRKIYRHIEIYGKEFAQDSIADIATGLIRLYEQDGELKVPIWGLLKRPINMMMHRGNSYAQTIYGGKAMEWDSDDVYNFTEQMRTILYGPGGDGYGFDLIKRIRKETGGTFWQAMGKRAGISLQLLIILLFYEFTQKLISEK